MKKLTIIWKDNSSSEYLLRDTYKTMRKDSEDQMWVTQGSTINFVDRSNDYHIVVLSQVKEIIEWEDNE